MYAVYENFEYIQSITANIPVLVMDFTRYRILYTRVSQRSQTVLNIVISLSRSLIK